MDISKNDLSDNEIIDLIVKFKEKDKYSILYDRYAKKVYHKCFFIIKSETKAEDLTHDVFLKAFLSLGTFSRKASFCTWLLTIAYNFCITYIRKNSIEKIIYNDELLEKEGFQVIDEIDDALIVEAPLESLKKGLNILEGEDKIILLMKYQENLSLQEIGEIFNIGLSATKMRIKRAKEKLVKIINALENDR